MNTTKYWYCHIRALGKLSSLCCCWMDVYTKWSTLEQWTLITKEYKALWADAVNMWAKGSPLYLHPDLHSTRAHPVRVSAWHSGCLHAKALPVEQKQQCCVCAWQVWDEYCRSSVHSRNWLQFWIALTHAVLVEPLSPHIATCWYTEPNTLIDSELFISFFTEILA